MIKSMSSKVKYLSSILAPVSLGELIDKITILEIKQIHMTGIKLKNVAKELKLLQNILQDTFHIVQLNYYRF